ncbi:hypothetical protein Patl1_15836 [Pistacia atlantica]|uniref:Uncharacterized protein n=1 Tax=Pistacia atlantica TaxID=434234 RepID=A0ACC1B659_9ROSI|nr:hypothetical protein Patl1_15836 [Pistacia atlantica]
MAYNNKSHKSYGIITVVLMSMCLFEAMHYTQAVHASADTLFNFDWLNHGGDLNNRRYASEEVLINPSTVKKLRLRWKFYAVNAFSGALIWKKNLGELTGLNGTGIIVNVTVSRTTPAIAGGLLIVGIYGPAVVIAVTRSNGRLLWYTQPDSRSRAQITMSGTVYLGLSDGRCSYYDAISVFLAGFYVGVSSLEEALPAEQCCSFRGSFAKLDVRTGRVIWRTYMLPDNGGKLGGYSGAAIWGSSPAIDVKRRRFYIGTGNLYIAPPDVLRCQELQNNQTTPPTKPDRQLGGYDVFYFACLVPNKPDCPPGPNIDADFGEAPMLLSIYVNKTIHDVAVAVQKSGFVWALDRDNGDIVWFKLAGPGGKEGGGLGGAATDGKRVYTNIANSDRVSFPLAPSTQRTTAGAWVALDASTGEIVWSTANPSNDTAQAPVTLENNLLFAGSVSPNGPLYTMDANTGKIIWSYDTNTTIYGGASAGYGCIYLGNGYTESLAKFHPDWTPGTSLHAFCIW